MRDVHIKFKMSDQKLPVTFDFFKKHTNHEECIEILMKLKANGDQQMYERLLNNEEARETALRSYYEAFYLKPEIREKYHIRLKMVPKKIKEKLLSIPVHDTCVTSKVLETISLNDIVKDRDLSFKTKTTVSPTKNFGPRKRFLLSTQDVFDGDCVADDVEPARSPDCTPTLAEPANLQKDKNSTLKSLSTPEVPSIITMERKTCQANQVSEKIGTQQNPKIIEVSKVLIHDCNKTSSISNGNLLEDPSKIVSNAFDENNQEHDNVRTAKVPEQCELNTDSVKVDANNVKQFNTNSNNVVPSTSAKENPKFDYKTLMQYRHCCPLSFNKFRKYSNIDKLVEEFCKNKNYDAHQQNIILNRSYLLFYLAPEHRTIPPIDKIQLLDNCPLAVKEIFFNIPKNLYLKEKNLQKEAENEQKQLKNLKETNNKVNQETASGSKTDSQQTQAIANNQEKTANSTHKPESATKSLNSDVRHDHNESYKKATSPANPQSSKSPFIEKKNNNIQQQEGTTDLNQQKPKATSKTVTFDIRQQTDEPAQQLHISKSNETKKFSTPLKNSSETKGGKQSTTNPETSSQIKLLQQAVNNCEDTNNKEKHITPSLNSPTDTIIKFPVTLNEFKKYTHYEEIVETFLKLKSHNNEELYLKYKNSKKAFNDTLMKYYKAFYLLPAIREFWPIRFKPLPSFMKSRLLQIPEGVIIAPLDQVTVKQIILSGINVGDVSDQEPSPSPQKTVEDRPLEKAASEKAQNNPLPISQSDVSMASIEPNPQSTDSDKCMKRMSTEDPESPSSKRPKIEQNPDSGTKSYKDLLPYIHLCPISFSDFTKYSNVAELFTGFCQKRYNCLKKLPLMLKRAYVLYYLAPENRYLKPLNKLKALETCPAHLREKVYQIPTNFRKEGDINFKNQEKILAESHKGMQNRQDVRAVEKNAQKNICSQQVNTSQRPVIEILENRLLPPIKQQKTGQPNKERYLCSASSCLFNHITYNDIEKHTNILTVQTEPLEINSLQIIFKKLICKIVKGQNCDDKFMISSSLTSKILKHKIICHKCECGAETNLKTATLSCSIAESDKTSNTSIETVVERCIKNKERMQITPDTETSRNQASQKVVEDQRKEKEPEPVADAVPKTQVSNKETRANTTANEPRITNTEVPMEVAAAEKQSLNTEISQIPTIENSAKPDTSADKRSSLQKSETNTQSEKSKAKTTTVGVWSDKLFSKICQKLLAKLEETTKGNVIFSTEIYKEFLECNEIPLAQLLMDTFGNNEENVQRILNRSEFVEALQRYFYVKYLTNADFALKYPVKTLNKNLEESNENTTQLPEEMDNESPTILEGTQQNLNRAVRKPSLSTSITIHCEENEESVQDVSNTQEQSITNNSALEKAKRIFFRNVDKTHTLAYVLRTTFGYKQYILRSVLNFTFDEFFELTNVYEGKELYNDKHIAECMYRYVFRTPLVWPTTLFITLENLCMFLRQRNIHFDNYSTMLFYISPKLLHWSNLLSCTNFLDCVKLDYEKRTGKLLDDDILILKRECIEYYNRCWKHEKWLTETPLLEEEFCKRMQFEDNEDDAAMVEEPPAEVYYEYQTEAVNHAGEVQVTDCVPDIIVLSPSQINRTFADEHDSNELNIVYLPNTQQQIEMLPAEQSVSNDPLYGNSPLHLDISQGSPESSDEVDVIGELVPNIKAEPVSRKLLSNLLFYEDDNDDMQCITCEEEVVELDTTLQSQIVGENLPSSQIDFDNLINSEDLHTLLAQHCPNMGEANTMQTGENILTELIQLPEASLLNTAENANINENMSTNMQNQQELPPVINEMLQNTSGGGCLDHANNAPSFQEAQRFPSTFEEIQISSATSVKPPQQQQVKKTVRDVIHSILHESDVGDQPSTSKTSCKSSYRTYGRKAVQAKNVEAANSKASAKTRKNVATVKPLQNVITSNLVPQIQHNKPALQTVPAHSHQRL